MRKRNKRDRIEIPGIIGLIIITALIMAIMYYLYRTYQKIEISDSNYQAEKVSVSTRYDQTVESELKNNKNVADVIEEVSKSVCGISKLQSTGSSILSMTTETELGLGTGIIVSSNGYILSNSHVTGEKYSTCYITIEDLNTYRGTVVWSDSDLDLSITKISANNLPYVELGTSEKARVGENVYAIGNPIGHEFRKTVTSGIISAVNRTIKLEESDKTSYMSNLIQTDATINPGNSGGPLIYGDGKVIGINSVKITSAEGIGFAVPIDVVKPVIESFIKNGSFEEAGLGIYGYDNSIAKSLKISTEFNSGIYVDQVIKGGPSEKSGIMNKDVILKIDGKSVQTINELRQYIYTRTPGDTVTLNIIRNKKTREFQVILNRK